MDAPEITVNLTRTDLNELKRLDGLATSMDNTYLSITAAALTDTFGIYVEPVAPRMALPASPFYGDTKSSTVGEL